jgi:DNA polymerase bacteriophage-type
VTGILSLDLETRSAADLKKTGAYRYFEDATADVLCAALALDDGPVLTWRRGDPTPALWQQHVSSGGAVSAHNAAFEYWALLLILGPRYGWAVPEIAQVRDTMAQAAAMSIPQALDGAARAMGLDEQKDKDGMRLIRKFSMPRKARKGEVPGRLYWTEPEDDPADFEKFVSYCAQDVEVERALRKLLVPLSPAEQDVWVFNLVMNTRGVRIDLDLVNALQKIAEQAKERLDREMAVATGYEITACSQVAALTRWLQAQGVEADKLNKNAIEELLADELPPAARRAVEIRKEAAKTSTAKLTSMLNCASTDGRVRGLHQYHGAGTGRWAGRLVQTQNMPRGTGTIKDPEGAVDVVLTGDAGWVDLIYGNPMSAVSDMLRSCLVASPGHRLLAADFSSIEGRVTAWVAGEDWKLEAFVANDEGRGAGMYELAAAGIFNVDAAAVTKPQRQVGKASELALGFGGGVMAYHSMARIYGIDMAPIFPILKGTADAEVIERATERYEECAERQDTGTDLMTREAWIASEITKVQWRARHPSTVALWAGLEEAARDAVMHPGSIATYGRIAYIVRRGFLWCRLPSGRCLAYGAPKVEDRKTPWGATKPSVTALGVNSQTKKWERFALYGGLATENVVQAIARDLMAHGMLMAEAAGYPIVMTVHDEAVADTPAGHGTLAEFERLLCDSPAWATGLPVVASGYESARYRKD